MKNAGLDVDAEELVQIKLDSDPPFEDVHPRDGRPICGDRRCAPMFGGEFLREVVVAGAGQRVVVGAAGVVFAVRARAGVVVPAVLARDEDFRGVFFAVAFLAGAFAAFTAARFSARFAPSDGGTGFPDATAFAAIPRSFQNFSACSIPCAVFTNAVMPACRISSIDKPSAAISS